MSGAGIPEKLRRSPSIRYLENVRRDHEDLGRGRRLMGEVRSCREFDESPLEGWASEGLFSVLFIPR